MQDLLICSSIDHAIVAIGAPLGNISLSCYFAVTKR